nr:DUF2442 domain-containing protein [Caldicoprobacter algeriensis]
MTFENGERRIFDIKPYLDKGIFQELKNEKMFTTVRVSFDSIEWSNHADIDLEVLYENSKAYNPTSWARHLDIRDINKSDQ